MSQSVSRFFQTVIKRVLASAMIAFIIISLSLLSSVQVLAQETPQAARASVTLIPEGGDFAAKNSKCGDITERFQSGQFEIWHVPCYVQYLSQTFIYFAGGIAVLFLVIGGYQYMIGGVSEDKEAGKKTMTYALAGFALTIVAWTLVNVWQVFITSGSDEASYAVTSEAGTYFSHLGNGELHEVNWNAYVENVRTYSQERFDNKDVLQTQTEFEGYEFSIDSNEEPAVDKVADGFEVELTCMNSDGLVEFQQMLITETTQRSATKDAARLCMRKLKKLELEEAAKKAAQKDCKNADIIAALKSNNGDGLAAATELATTCSAASLGGSAGGAPAKIECKNEDITAALDKNSGDGLAAATELAQTCSAASLKSDTAK